MRRRRDVIASHDENSLDQNNPAHQCEGPTANVAHPSWCILRVCKHQSSPLSPIANHRRDTTPRIPHTNRNKRKAQTSGTSSQLGPPVIVWKDSSVCASFSPSRPSHRRRRTSVRVFLTSHASARAVGERAQHRLVHLLLYCHTGPAKIGPHVICLGSSRVCCLTFEASPCSLFGRMTRLLSFAADNRDMRMRRIRRGPPRTQK